MIDIICDIDTGERKAASCKLFQVQTTDDMWNYIKYSFVPALLHGNNRYIADDTNILVGIARIRQLRVTAARGIKNYRADLYI